MAPLALPTPAMMSLHQPDLTLSASAIVLITVVLYLLVLLLLLSLRHCLLTGGVCAQGCDWGEFSGCSCRSCWVTCAEISNCRVPTVNQCLDLWCPRSRGCSCGRGCECACAFQPPDCETLNCICFEIKLR
uniref:Uncharacterized protein n=1 Tax=Callorhinchus milii TaxID=7868 RepID=V9LJQ2_CALMI